MTYRPIVEYNSVLWIPRECTRHWRNWASPEKVH